MENQKTTSEEWKKQMSKFYGVMFECGDYEQLVDFISTLIAQKQKEAIESERQRIWNIIVDEFEELQLSFHEGFGGNRISECQKKIVERIKIIQNAKEKINKINNKPYEKRNNFKSKSKRFDE